MNREGGAREEVERAAAGADASVSRGDGALLLTLLLLLAVAASLTPIRNYDYWWHLATGRLILETGSVPRADPFSFTAPGTPWVDHEWLFQVGARLLHGTIGPTALVLLKVAACLLICPLVAAHLTRVGHGPAGMAVLLVTMLVGASFRLDVRPEIATLMLVPVAIHLALRARDNGDYRGLLAIPVLAALHANLHPGAILTPAFLGLGAITTFVAERFGAAPGAAAAPGARRFAPRLLLVAAVSALAIGVNPYGFHIYAVPFDLSRVLASLPAPNLEWARPRPGDFPLFFVAVAALVFCSALAPRRIDPVATPAALLAAALGLAHLRNIGIFFLLFPYGIARPARALVEAVEGRTWYRAGTLGGRVRPGFLAAATLLLGGIPMLVALPPGIVWGAGMASGNEPAAAVDFLDHEGVGDRLFNDVLFGGYLVWRRFPDRSVFIDGRNEVYAPLLRDIFGSLKDGPAWERLLERHGIDAAMLRYPPTLQKVWLPAAPGHPPLATERAFSAVYFPKQRWALVYWDDDAMIFVKRAERYKDVISRLEYAQLNPDDWRYVYAGTLMGRLAIVPIQAEIDRKLAEDPACERARRLRAAFAGLADALRQGRPQGRQGGR